jgi:LacI family transcriptional regulator
MSRPDWHPAITRSRTAVRLMLEEIRCKRSGKPKAGNHQVMKYSLVKRESSAAPPRG